MLNRSMDLLACSKGGFGSVVLTCGGRSVMHHVDFWKELNQFDGIELLSLGIKLLILCSFYDLMVALNGHSFSSLKEFLDICNSRRCL